MYNVHYSICAITSYSILPTVYENTLKIRATSGALLYVVATIDRARSRATFAFGVYEATLHAEYPGWWSCAAVCRRWL